MSARAIIALAAMLCAVADSSARAADACTDQGTMETDFGRAQSVDHDVASGQLPDATAWIDGGPAAFRYFKALVRVDPVAKRRWTLYVRDRDYRVIDVVTDAHVTATGSAWTGRLSLPSPVYFDFVAVPAAGPALKVTRLVLMPSEATNPYYSVQAGVPRFRDITDSQVPIELRRAGDSVGMLLGTWDNKAWCCSAVAVGPEVVLTNWHCGGIKDSIDTAQYWQQSICDRTVFDFSWDKDGIAREFQCTEVLQSDENADFALVRVKPRNGNDALRPMAAWSATRAADDPLMIVQHPACRPKQATLPPQCKTVDPSIAGGDGTAKADFSHVCDTMNGSSGSPVFDEKYRFVGLHHRGFEKQGAACDLVNKAIHASTISGKLSPKAKSALGGAPQIEP